MRDVHPTRRALLIAPALALALRPAGAQGAEAYQRRDRRYEGIRARPVSGYDVELLSFLAGPRAPAAPVLPPVFGLRFHLPAAQAPLPAVHIVVRDIDGRFNYWLDRVEPDPGWTAGFGNEFRWPTADVVGRVPGLGLAALGAVVRLGRDHPAALETVAPALLHAGQVPPEVTAYQACFRTNGSARVAVQIFRDGQDKPLWQTAVPRQMGGVPLVVDWDAGTAEPGAYRLLLRGFFLDSNRPFQQSVQFWHERRVA